MLICDWPAVKFHVRYGQASFSNTFGIGSELQRERFGSDKACAASKRCQLAGR